MKSFWQRPLKKGKKKKRNTKAAPSKKTQLAVQIPQSSSWIPPFLTNEKTPVAGDTFIAKTPVTYRITANQKETDTSIPAQLPTPTRDEPKLYLRGQQARKEFMKLFEKLTSGRWRSWDIWTDFVTMAACAISNAVDKLHYDERETIYMRTIQKYNKEEQQIFPELFAWVAMGLEENPEQDFLGDLYTELGLNSKEHRQIFTPYPVARLMSEFTLNDIAKQVEDKGFVTIHDCCCGGGVTMIAAANVAKERLEKVNLNFQNYILITGQDIDPVVTMMCYIQLSLLGIAGYLKVGNALTEPITNNDSIDNYWFTPMYYSSVWHYRRVWHMISGLFEMEGVLNDAEVHED